MIESARQNAGWLILAVIVVSLISVLGYQEMNGRVSEARQEAAFWEGEALEARRDAEAARLRMGQAIQGEAEAMGELRRIEREIGVLISQFVDLRDSFEDGVFASTEVQELGRGLIDLVKLMGVEGFIAGNLLDLFLAELDDR